MDEGKSYDDKSYEERGDEYFQQALSLNDRHCNDKCDLYTKATKQYLLSVDHKSKVKACDCYELIAKLYIDNGRNYEAAWNYREAGDMYSTCDLSQSKRCYLIAIDLYLVNKKYNDIAKLYSLMAAITLKEKENDINSTISYYEKTYEYYELANSKSTALLYLVKAAYLLIQKEEYNKAISYLEKSNEYYTSQNSTKFKSKSVNFGITIVKMCNNILQYNIMNNTDYHDVEYCFLLELDNSIKAKDRNMYDDILIKFKSVRVLDPWMEKIFQTIRNLI
jgi:tetratricopeptide (TPR) repeat protein